MPIFTENDLLILEQEQRAVHAKYAKLFFAVAALDLKSPLAQEMALQGFARRLKALVFCIGRVFARIPPSSDEIPAPEVVTECEVCLQSFVFNVFGCIDNLANMWVKEREVKRPGGKEISPMMIGLGEKYTDVRASLSAEMQNYLSSAGMQRWFTYLEDYRHALAHRIPLYIPPHTVMQSNVEAYQEFDNAKRKALQAADFAAHDRLVQEQMKLCVFQPYIKHTWDDNRAPVRFHERMLADYATVVDLGWRMLEELKRTLATEDKA